MSGLYTPRHGVYTVNTGARGKAKFRQLVPAPNKTTLDPKFVTMAEVLKQAGYATALFGKWHLGRLGQAGPGQQGFDYVVGGTAGMGQGGYFSPYQNPQLADGPPGENLTDRLSEEVVRYLTERGEAEQQAKPFFVYLPYFAVHSPWQGKPELIKQTSQRKPVGGHDNPTYAAMIETLDTGIGRILKTLDDLELAKNTLVIFYSDNGGVGGYREAGVQGAKNVTSQAPLRGGKGMLYEGGIRVPMIVHWPGVTSPGSVCDTPITSVDFLPTLAEIAGANVSGPCDGVSFSTLLRGQPLDRGAIYWHFPGYLQASEEKGTWRTTPCGALRSGRWKLIEFFEDGQLELYDLQDDIGETMNLAEKQPDKTGQFHQQLQAWREDVDAPMPKPKPTDDGG
jgi:arylsulfatase A-like enzyme